MTRYVALLRGINLGRNRRVAMADLRALLAGLGYEDVRTLLQSGNAVFSGRAAKPDRVAAKIEAAIQSDLGMAVTTFVRTADEVRAVVDGNPLNYPDGSRMLVGFLSASPAPDRLDGLDPADFAPEDFRVGERAIYYWCPNGQQGSPVVNTVTEKQLGVTMTVRNWNTVTKLLALLD